MVYLLSSNKQSLSLTLLAQWVRFDVAVADAFPASAVAFVGIGVTLVVVVAFVHDLLMLGAVLLVFSKPTAAGVGAGTLGFVWHREPPFGHNKSRRELSLTALAL